MVCVVEIKSTEYIYICMNLYDADTFLHSGGSVVVQQYYDADTSMLYDILYRII